MELVNLLFSHAEAVRVYPLATTALALEHHHLKRVVMLRFVWSAADTIDRLGAF